MKMKHLVFTWLLLGIVYPTQAQEQPLRVEIETKYRSEGYRVVTLGNDGLMLFIERKDKVLGGQNTFHFTYYDTHLQKKWEGAKKINNWMTFQGYDVDNGKLYLIFTRFASEDFEFLRIDPKSEEISKYKVPAIKRLAFKDISVMEDYAFVAGNVKGTPILLHIDLKVGTEKGERLKLLPSSTTRKSEFEFLDKDTTNRLINFNYVNWKGNESYLTLRSYDPTGEALSEIQVPRTENKNLLEGKQSITEEGNAVIIGTYANGSSKLSSGLYITEFNGNEQLYMNYYNFADLQHFFDYLPEKQRERMERKKERKESKDKDLNLEYRLLIHNLVSKGDKYTLIAEAYYPTYRYDNGGTGVGNVGIRSRYSYPLNRSQRIFDGFQYTHAILASFTKDGKLEWDNSLELEQVKYFNLRQVVKVNFTEDDKVKLLYHYKGDLLSKVIDGNQVVADESEITISTDYNNDKIKRAYRSDLSFWYKNYFLAWGFQRIKNKEDDVRNVRNVFFFNKIPF